MIAIELKNVYKNFNLVHERHSSHFKKRVSQELSALKKINLKIKKGECFGAIGPNGSGKSTLLKIIAGIYHPTKGSVDTNGKLLTLLDIGVGLNPEFTGWENIFLYGSLLGLTRSEIKENLDKIIEFSQLELFIDAKLKDYSNGMKLRLAFSIAMVSNPDIIIIDEILAVGDEEFQRKSFNKIKLFKEQGKTIVIVSHDLSSIRELCDRAVFLDKGEIQCTGIPQKVIIKYLEHTEKYKREYVYKSLNKLYNQYKDICNELQDLENAKKNTINLPIISKYFEINLDRQIGYLIKQQVKIKLDLLDKIDSILDESRVLIRDFWRIYNVERITSKSKKVIFSQIEQSKQSLKICQEINNKIDEEKIQLQKDLTSLELELSTSSKNKEKLIKQKIENFQKHLSLDELSKSYKKKIGEEFRIFVSHFDFSTIGPHLIIESILEYKKTLISLNIKPEDDIMSDVRMIARYYLNYVDEFVAYFQLKLDESNAMEKKDINKNILKLAKFRLLLTKNFIAEKKVANLLENEKKVKITDLVFLNKNNRKANTFYTGDQFKIKLMYKTDIKINKPVFGIGIYRDDGVHITGPNTKFHNINIPYISGEGSVSYMIDKLPLLEGTYFVSATIHPYDTFEPYDHHDKRYSFKIKRKDIKDLGIMFINSKWKY